MSIKQLQVFATTDGKQFQDMAAAEAHQFSLDNAEMIGKVSNSFANTSVNGKEVGLVGRTRAFNVNVMSAGVAFLLAHGLINVDALAVFEEIQPSEDLAARIAADEAAAAAKAEAAAAKKAAATGADVKTEETESPADAEEDLFAE
ncbi:hypothetical protein Spp001_38 [Shewanella phage Spp001]|uniref:Uncharacterized protein n=1 Tax=Shewanella phage Spp001 TaxID=1445859 RepID=W6E9I3_9CAUD|nr:hypothetical protein Spp001_38 [Shewanella phage Spp001]AHJ10546.1 hypothetical protein Spp001_38 [Shewanella phage Spp001]